MSMSTAGLPEYIKFLDSHLALQILDFYINKTRSEDILKYKKQILFKTMLFDQQSKFIEENSNLFTEDDKQNLVNKKEKLALEESGTKQRIIGFLNLSDNCRR